MGVITAVKDDKVTGRSGQTIPKKRLYINGVVPISNNASDIIMSGIPGEGVLLPSVQIDDPSTAEDGNAFRAKLRKNEWKSMQEVAKLNTVSASFYTTGKIDGKEGPTAAATATVGMEVEVIGVCAQPVGSSLYVNAARITPVGSAPAPYDVAKKMMAYCMRSEMALQAAYNCSRVLDGCFDIKDLNPAQVVQATACQALFKRHIEGTADRLNVMAAGQPEDVAREITAHEERIRGVSPKSIADGSQILWLKGNYDSDIAPIVLSGISPWSVVPPLVETLSSGRAVAASLPNTFVVPKVTDVEIKGGGVTIQITTAFCFNREAAVDALEEQVDNPLILSNGPSACVSLSLKDLASRYGTFNKDRVTLIANETLAYCDGAFFCKVGNLEKGAIDTIKSDFPTGYAIDMVATLQKTSVLVTEEFIKKNLTDGNSQFVPESDSSDQLEPLENAPKNPILEKEHYQELTSVGWKFASLNAKTPAGKTLQYRVIYEGATKALEADQTLAMNTSAGEKHLNEISNAADVSISDMLIAGAVYAIVA
jgi:hypothetical protein